MGHSIIKDFFHSDVSISIQNILTSLFVWICLCWREYNNSNLNLFKVPKPDENMEKVRAMYNFPGNVSNYQSNNTVGLLQFSK